MSPAETIKFQEFAKLELRHIQLELECGRGQHLRHFVDQYFCYKNHYRKKSGAADWESIVWKEWISIEASQVTDRKKVVKEHVMPLKQIRLGLLNLDAMDLVSISSYLDEHLIFATITKSEDKLLRDNQLTSSMPKEYYESGHALFRDHFARYKKLEIQITRN